MSLQSIAQTLYNQANSGGVITINDMLLGSGTAFSTLVQQNLLRSAGNVLLTASAANIPQNPGVNSFTFPAGIPATAADAFLNLSGNKVTVVISAVTVNNNIVYQVQLSIDLTVLAAGGSTTWLFSNSYPSLLGWPFDRLPLQAPQFIFMFGQNSLPAGISEGLNFNAAYTLTGILGPLLQLLQMFGHNAPAAAPFTGLITQTPNGPSFALKGNVDGVATLPLQALTVSAPVVEASMEYHRPDNNPQAPYEPWGQIVLNTTTQLTGQTDPLNVSFVLSYETSSPFLTLVIAPQPGSVTTSINSLGQWMAGKSWDEFFAAAPASSLLPFLSNFGLQSYSLSFTLGNFSILSTSLAVGTLRPWTIIDNKLVMSSFSVGWQLIDPFNAAYSSVAISGKLDMFSGVDQVTFTGSILLPDLQLSFALYSQKTMTAAQWLQTIVTGFGGPTIPSDIAKALSTFSLTVMLLSMDVPGKNMTFTLAGQLTVGSTPVDFNINLAIGLEPQFTYDIQVEFVFSSVTVAGEITNTGGKTVISCSWQNEANPLDLNDIAIALGFGSLGIPQDLDMGLKQITLVYDITDSIFTIGAASANYGKADLIVFKPTGSNSYTFFGGLHVDKPIDLTNLPLVGQALSALEKVEIDKLKVLVTSDVITPGQVGQLNALILQLGAEYPSIPAEGMASTVNISMEFNVGGYIIPLGSGVGGKSTTNMPANKSSVQGPATGNTNTPVTSTPGNQADGTTWFNVQKAVGPVMFRRIGVRYQESVLWFLLDANFTAGGLSIELVGMGIGSPLSSFSPQFTLSGLGIEFSEPGFSIGGSFFKVPPSTGVAYEYAGGAVIKASSFSITALGSYASIYTDNTHTSTVPSMFVFGQVTGSFGGPPVFFVTGFAGGFGYNSSLRLPGMNELYQFPLVAGAQNPSVIGGATATPAEVLRILLGLDGGTAWISHEVGQYWFAAGLQFSTFSIVSTNALLIIQFGKRLQFALLGLSRARFPMSGSVTYAFIELQIETIVDPGQGIFSLTAILSPNSYLLDPSCRLMGGFAFYAWYTPSDHAGDFVITLGGYHPSFDPPDWYPQIPRVGFTWSLDSTVSITGTAYFAMTPAAAMAGAQLSVTYQEGNLRAWFKAWANMLVYWNPFHFDVELGTSIGASYRLDLGFTNITLEAELGADIHLWGPSTGGTATVHWWVISFTIDFGATQTGNPDALKWPQFMQQLPKAADLIKMVPGDGLAPNGNADLNAADPWIVRPSQFSFSVTSAVPNSQLLLGSSETPFQQGSLINIRPMQTNAAGNHLKAVSNTGKDLTSKHTLTVTYNGAELNLVTAGWTVNPRKQNVPKAMWGTGPQTQVPDGNDQLVKEQLTGFDLAAPATQFGYTPGIINVTLNLASAPLLAGTLPVQPGKPAQGPIAQAGANTILMIEQQIASVAYTKARNDLFKSLGDLGIKPGTDGDMTKYAERAGSIFPEEPLVIPVS
ncbi:DUF6603 domain-containing protein [Paraflavitalea sp. CAU 1676]|uniref:DUF6603 domain-containing protein n=1 Tax=Paraflavitalea sp. CAU 1676 TaxID=3032598 RepID=UPI0023DA0B32|nr:DUF6603 domain-containing protein [Paraflavitalea sp. CAU 1676]MDF2193256.1 hypothetical protein [Paraflavitalea sp. CAU 1676]